MRVVTALLICLGMTICGLSSLAQTSTSVPSAPASRAESAIETPRAPVFEYLGRLRAVGWTDSSRNFWLFGGDGYDFVANESWLNDLWKYSAGQ
jgi:hypothetical protein